MIKVKILKRSIISKGSNLSKKTKLANSALLVCDAKNVRIYKMELIFKIKKY